MNFLEEQGIVSAIGFQLPSFWNLHDEASIRATKQLEAECKSEKCICGKQKWAYYPFCRSCSIRALRAHLYKPALKVCAEFKAGRIAPDHWRGYDIARDFVLARPKKKRREDEDE